MLRNKFANKFTQISNAVLNDPELSLEEKGLFCYLFSKPDCWEFHYNVMRNELKEKSDKTVRKILNSLVEKEYITKVQINNANGQFGGIDIEFTNKSFLLTEGKNTDAANLPVGKNAEPAKIPPNNTNNIINTNLSNNTNKKFKKPTAEEVRNYCKEIEANINADGFIDFYESKGWLIGKNLMKDWKAAVRTWVRNSGQTIKKPKKQTKEEQPIFKFESHKLTEEENKQLEQLKKGFKA